MDARRLSRAIITIARDFNRGGLSVGTSVNLWIPPCLPRAGMGSGKHEDYRGRRDVSIASSSFRRRPESRKAAVLW